MRQIDLTVMLMVLGALPVPAILGPAAARSPAAATSEEHATGRGLVVFTLVRGGPSEGAYESFVNSRDCIRGAMPSEFIFDNVAFHEDNVPSHVQVALRQRV
jgi:hypothetical protein